MTIPTDLETSFRSAWSRLGVADKASFSKALDKMTILANADADEAHRKAVLAAQSCPGEERQRLSRPTAQRTRPIWQERIAGGSAGGGPACLPWSPWVGKAAQELSTSVYDDASFSGGVLLNAAETAARINALNEYAQGIRERVRGSA